MAKFKTAVELTLDGETLRVRTRADDMLTAERQLGHSPQDTPIELQWRIYWRALRRDYPDHPASKTFGTFVEALEGADELEAQDAEDPDPLDPIPPADSDT